MTTFLSMLAATSILLFSSGPALQVRTPPQPSPDEASTDLTARIERTIQTLNPSSGILGILTRNVWVSCTLIPRYDFSQSKQLGNSYSVGPDGAGLNPGVEYDHSSPIGFLLKFNDSEWGGRKLDAVKFRKGQVGWSGATGIFVSEGTEAQLEDKVYVFRSKKWRIGK